MFGDTSEMIKIYIVGTDHNFQKGHESYKEAAAEFRQYINDVCSLAHVKAIGEEMSREALAEAGVEKSTCEMLVRLTGDFLLKIRSKV